MNCSIKSWFFHKNRNSLPQNWILQSKHLDLDLYLDIDLAYDLYIDFDLDPDLNPDLDKLFNQKLLILTKMGISNPHLDLSIETP